MDELAVTLTVTVVLGLVLAWKFLCRRVVARDRLIAEREAVVVKVALPPDSVAVPRSRPVVTSLKSTLPVGVPELAATAAVSVTP